MKKCLPIISLLLLSFSIIACSVKESPSGLEEFQIRSEHLNDTLKGQVWLPASYRSSDHKYPVLVMLDGEYAFDVASSITSYLQRDKELSEFVIVGLSYDVGFGEPLAEKRSRDFTPPLDEQGAIKHVDSSYYLFVRDELLPMLDDELHIDPAQRTLWSYSLSGSLAAWLSYPDPSLFKNYIFASGNLIDYGIIQKLFGGEIFKPSNTEERKVFISYDRSEVPDPKILDQGAAMLQNPEALPGYRVKFWLTEGESHASSWLVTMPAGLRHIYGAK